MSRFWQFPDDQFGMFVDVTPTEILNPDLDRVQALVAVHCSGAPKEEVKWLRQFKDVAWGKKPWVIEQLTDAAENKLTSRELFK